MKRLLLLTAACTVVQGLCNIISLVTGCEVLAYLGGMVAVISGGLLPGFVSDLLGTFTSIFFGDERYYTVPVDFVVLLVTGYIARRGYLRSFRTWILPGILVGLSAGLVSVVINNLIGRYALGVLKASEWISHLPGWSWGMYDTESIIAAYALVHLLDVLFTFAILSLAAQRGWLHVAGGLSVDEWKSRHVRRQKLGVKFVVYLTASALFTGGLLFVMMTGVYYHRMEDNYTTMAANYADAVAEFVPPHTLDRILYPDGNKMKDYEHLDNQVAYFARRTDQRLRHVYIAQISYAGEGRPFLRILVDPGLDGKPYGTPIMTGSYHALMPEKDISLPGAPFLGPYWTPGHHSITVYKPLYNTQGVKEAYVGIDMDMTDAYGALRRMEGHTAAIECIVFGLLMALVYSVITREVISPVEKLADNLIRFGETGKKETTGRYRLTSGDELEVIYHAIDETQDQLVRDKEELASYTDRIARMARMDPLTGAGSHAAYVMNIARLNQDIENGQAAFAVIMADMNGLKQINDRCGHAKGDLALKTMAETIAAAIPGSPVFRMGGDEFVAILEGENYEKRDILFGNLLPFRHPRRFTAKAPWEETALSAGMGVFQPGVDHSFQDVFNRADAMMYKDKKRYGGRS